MRRNVLKSLHLDEEKYRVHILDENDTLNLVQNTDTFGKAIYIFIKK